MLAFLFSLLFAQQRAATVPHQATLYYQSPACTTSAPCQITVYRAVCPRGPSTCPSYGNGHGWTRVTSGSGSATPTATGTQWVIVDNDPALQDATTYNYVAITAYTTAPGQTSQPSPAWSGTTSSGSTPNTPQPPTVGTGNSVQ